MSFLATLHCHSNPVANGESETSEPYQIGSLERKPAGIQRNSRFGLRLRLLKVSFRQQAFFSVTSQNSVQQPL
jgi:hypothetical protein